MNYDVVIIGAGPAGLTAGIYARSKGMTTLLLDSGRVGGQLVSLYPEKGIHNYPGFETIQARKLSASSMPRRSPWDAISRRWRRSRRSTTGRRSL